MQVTLPAAVTLDEAGAVLRQLQAALAKGGEGALVVDAGALAELDTAAIALLLHAQRLAAAKGLGFELKAPPDKLVALARLYGVGSLLPGVEAAKAAEAPAGSA